MQPGNRKRQHESYETSCSRTVAHKKINLCNKHFNKHSVCYRSYHIKAERCFCTNQRTAKYKLGTEQEITHTP